MKKLMLIGLATIALAGCCATPEPDAVTQERALTDVVRARDERNALDSDMSPAAKQDVLDFWKAWDSWLTDRERRVK